ncbi:MAG: hypothetical protein GWP06_08765 [Actinobacteria bacterium]|nr:hypothetical protein [Actinomycetota bacterium]
MRFFHYLIMSLMMVFTAPLYPVSFMTSDEPMEKLLPADSQIAPWTKSGKPEIYKSRELFNYIDGGADIYLEYGFSQVISQEYSYEEESIVADIYEMNDPEAAFGIYSIHRDAHKPAAHVGDDGTEFDYQITFWQDRYYVILLGYSSDKETKNVLQNFAKKISAHIPGHANPPQIIHFLPKKFRVPRSESSLQGMLAVNSKLYLGQKNILNIDGDTVTAACASYKRESDTAQLLLVKYAHNGDSERHENIIRKAFEKKYKSIGSAKKAIFKDGKNRFYKVKAVKNMLFIIFKSTSQGLINNILNL